MDLFSLDDVFIYICGRRRAWNIKIQKQSVKRLQNISIFNLSILKYHGCFKINPFPAIYNRFFLGKLSAYLRALCHCRKARHLTTQ